MLAHFMSCAWVFVGRYDEYMGNEPAMTWLSSENFGFRDRSWHYKYVFAVYWVFQTITTVGYGDLSLSD